MPTDVKLDQGDGNHVVIEGNVLKATTSDFMLDSPARRKKPGLRRALVHDQQDGLTMNYNHDYPGGVTINDVVSLNNRHTGISILGVKEIAGTRLVGGGSTDSPSHDIPTQNSILTLRGQIMLEGLPAGPTASASSSGDQRPARSDTASLQRVILDLQNQVARLTRQVAELEKRHQ